MKTKRILQIHDVMMHIVSWSESWANISPTCHRKWALKEEMVPDLHLQSIQRKQVYPGRWKFFWCNIALVLSLLMIISHAKNLCLSWPKEFQIHISVAGMSLMWSISNSYALAVLKPLRAPMSDQQSCWCRTWSCSNKPFSWLYWSYA